ncbi:MAG: tetratricopeptide repeat protein [Isosphaerales bacterium]
MSGRPMSSRLFASLCILSLHATPAAAQDIPLGALRDWMYYDEGGRSYLDKGDYTKAEIQFNMAIQQIKPYSARNPRLMARSYCDLARVLYHQRRYAEAEPLAKWALSVREADKKAGDDAVFQALYTLGLIHSAQQHFSEAEPLLKRALALQEKVLSMGHVNTLTTLDQLAMVYREQRKYKEAELLYLRAVAIHERKTPDQNLDLADTADNYAALLRKMNRTDEAENWEARALKNRDTVATRRARAKADQTERTLKSFK